MALNQVLGIIASPTRTIDHPVFTLPSMCHFFHNITTFVPLVKLQEEMRSIWSGFFSTLATHTQWAAVGRTKNMVSDCFGRESPSSEPRETVAKLCIVTPRG